MAALIFFAGFREARAQTGPVYVRINLNGWIYAPALVNDQVAGFLVFANTTDATQDMVTTTGSNLQTLWCQRDGVQDWSVWAWNSISPALAAVWIESYLSAPDAFSEYPTLAVAMAALVNPNPSAPTEVVDGLFVNDPLQAVMAAATDKPALAASLAEMGWVVAPVVSAMNVTSADPCDEQASNYLESALNYHTQTVEVALFGDSDVTNVCAQWCSCTTTTAPQTAGAWTSHTKTVGDRVKCEWQRQWTYVETYTGKYLICTSCAGSATFNARCEYGADDYLFPHTCAGSPPSTVPTSFTNGTCSGW